MNAELPLQIITPIGMIGYGYNYELFEETCNQIKPDAIIADAGSTDGGPGKLAFGTTTTPRDAYVRDFEPILRIAHKHGILVLFGSAGGHGSNAHVDFFVEIVQEICARERYSFKVASIYAEIDHALVTENIEAGLVAPCGPVPPLTAKEVSLSTRIVAQMGAEPFIKALDEGAQIIIGGRAYDPSPYAAVCIRRGIDPGVAWHMGKICECGALCATPKGRTIIATVRKNDFDLESMEPSECCTITSVAAHTLYEKSRPDILVGPGGILDLKETTYKQLDNRVVRVRGAVFRPMPYTVKLEGVKPVGYRTMFIGGIRDPILISQIDKITQNITAYVQAMTSEWDPVLDKIAWHVYGRNGVMGALEPESSSVPFELAVMGEVLASTQARANVIASLARIALLHCPYPGQMATAGNCAFPFAPFETPLGPFAEFNIYHILPISNPLSLFPITYHNIAHDPSTNGSSNLNWNSIAKVADAKGDESRAAAFGEKVKKASVIKPSMAELVKSGRSSATIAELASVVRSKNAGPYELTFDVMFADEETYRWVKHSGVLNIDILSAAYHIKPVTVVACLFWDQARAFKFTIPRPMVQGGFGETDMHCAQQHVPIMRIEVSLPLALPAL